MGIKRSFRAHPAMVISFLKPFLFILLIPLFRALVQAVLKRQVSNLLLSELLLSVVIFGCSVIKWHKFNITIGQSHIFVFSGVFSRRQAKIPINKISTIDAIRYPLDFILGSVTLKINTEAGRIGKADYKIKLKRTDAEYIIQSFGGGKKVKNIKFSAVRVAVMAATASSAFTGLIIVVPIINQIGELLGTAISEILLERISSVSKALGNYVPPIVNTITIIFLLSYASAFLISFFKCVNFRVGFSDNKMKISSGIFAKRQVLFKTSAVNSICIEQTPFMRLFKRYLLRVGIGGYGDRKGDKAIVVPSAKHNEVKEFFSIFFPSVDISKKLIKPGPSSRMRFYFIPTIFLLVIVAGYGILLAIFPVFRELLVFALLVNGCIVVYYYNLAEYNVKNSAISISNIIYSKYTRWSATREMFCEAKRIGMIHITKWPADKRRGTCNVRLTVRSEDAESITIKHISYKELLEDIRKIYKL